MDNKKKVLILGSNGFIGTNLSIFFNKIKDIKVIAANKTINKLEQKNCDFYKCNLLNAIAVKNLIKKTQPNFIINCAFIGVNSRVDYSQKYIIDNLKLATNIIQSCQNIKSIRKIINIGSGLEYADSPKPIDENFKISAKNIYAAVKAANSLTINAVAQKLNLPLITIRPFHLFGPYDNKSVLFYLIKNCLLNKEIRLTKGEQIYDYLYIKDFCYLIEQIINNYKRMPNFEFYNIGSGNKIKLKKLFKVIIKKINSHQKIEYLAYAKNEYFNHVANISKIKKYVKWQPIYSLDKGAEETIIWVAKVFKDKEIS